VLRRVLPVARLQARVRAIGSLRAAPDAGLWRWWFGERIGLVDIYGGEASQSSIGLLFFL